MKDIAVIDSEIKLTKIDIDLLEQKLKMNLPIEYKEFLLLHNGGHPEKDNFDFFEINNSSFGFHAKPSSNVSWFYAFYEGEHENLLKEVFRFSDRIPNGFVPIARDAYSNKICICVHGSEYGKVYFWEFSQAVPYREEPTFDNMHLLANNFTDFINGLYRFVDLRKGTNGEEIWIHSHDKYSLPLSTEAKKYGALVTDFFSKAPAEVEDYIIEENLSTKDLLLRYDVISQNMRYVRRIDKNGKMLVEWIEKIK